MNASTPSPDDESGAYQQEVESFRPPYRPPIGIPLRDQRQIVGLLGSIFLHLIIVALVALPILRSDLVSELMGAGGDTAAGGGGGGRSGSSGGRIANERLTYVVPPQPTVQPDPERLALPVETPPPEVVPPVQEPEPIPPQEEPQQPEATEISSSPDEPGTIVGTGGDPGGAGGSGTGQGSGGGIGSGIGTGTGSSVGQGSGGGESRIFPASPSELFIPPVPIPNRVKGRTITVVFDIDSTGKVIDFDFTPTRDASYNRKLRDLFAATRFRPATDENGRPMTSKFSIDYKFQ